MFCFVFLRRPRYLQRFPQFPDIKTLANTCLQTFPLLLSTSKLNFSFSV